LFEQAHNKVLVMLNEPIGPEDDLKVTINRCGEKIEVLTAKKRNPFTIMFTVPGRFNFSTWKI